MGRADIQVAAGFQVTVTEIVARQGYEVRTSGLGWQVSS